MEGKKYFEPKYKRVILKVSGREALAGDYRIWAFQTRQIIIIY